MSSAIDHVSTTSIFNKSALEVSEYVLVQAENGSTIVYGVTRAAGEDRLVAIKVWRVGSDGAMYLLETVEAGAGPTAAFEARISVIPSEQASSRDDLLIVTGLEGQPVWSQSINSNGTLAGNPLTVFDHLPDDITITMVVTVVGMNFTYCARLRNDQPVPVIYAIGANDESRLVSSSPHWSASKGIKQVNTTELGDITEEETGGHAILVATFEGEDMLVTYRVGMSGSLLVYDSVMMPKERGMPNPSVIEGGTICGEIYALFGGSGCDHFMLSADGTHDNVHDDVRSEDSIDLSFLRSLDQLTVIECSDGDEIRFGDEVLRICTEYRFTPTLVEPESKVLNQGNMFFFRMD